MNDAPYNSALADNDFKLVHDAEIDWTVSDAGLPPGVQTKRFMFDTAMKRRTSKVLFPPGYIEPRHTHRGWHNVLVLEGRMCVAGKELRTGDFVFGWDLPHGPFEYPDGCKVFAVSMGESMHHEWEWEPFLSYRRQWQPETEQGRAAASNSIAGGPRWRGSAGCRGRKPGSGFSAGAAKSESVTFAANGGEHPVEMARGPASEPAKAQIDETTRARLLDAAEKLFAECGFEGTSVRAINAEADVNSGAIHYYFRTKEDLFRAVIKRRAEILSSDRLTRLARCAEGPGTPSMLEQIIAAYILPYTNPKLGAPEQRLRFARLRARLMAEQQDADPSPLGAEHKFTGQRFVDALVATLPHLSQHEVRVRYMIMWSSLNTLSAGLGHAALDPAGPEKGHALQEFERIVPELVQLFAAMFREAIGLAPIQPGAARVGKKGTGRAAGVR